MMRLIAQSAPDDRPLAEWERTAQVLFKEAFNNIDTAFPTGGFLLALSGLLIILLALWGWNRARQHKFAAGPTLTFHRIANNAGLSLTEQWLLLRISRRQSLPTPITLMLSGATLDHHARDFVEHLSPRRRDAVRTRIKQIGLKMFG